MSSDGDPLMNYRFLVEVDAIISGGFSEVTGLDRSIETHEYDEGGVNAYTHTLWSGESSSNVTLKRGLTRIPTLWAWIEASATPPVERKTVVIIVLDEQGRPGWGWALTDAYPVGWSGPDFDAENAQVAVESLELTHMGIESVEELGRG